MQYVVSTSIAPGENAARLELDLWDVGTGERAREWVQDVALDSVGKALGSAGWQLVTYLPELGKTMLAEPEHPLVPAGPLVERYLAAYDQLFALALAREGLVDAERQLGRRDLLGGLLDLSLQERHALLPKLLFLCALELDRGCGSA